MGWIDTEDHVYPIEGKEVLALDDRGEYYLAKREGNLWICTIGNGPIEGVFYWMPLPDKPEDFKRRCPGCGNLLKYEIEKREGRCFNCHMTHKLQSGETR